MPEVVLMSGKWKARQMKLEAMSFLALARLLIALVRFRRWSRWLGSLVQNSENTEEAMPCDYYLAGVVARAAEILPIRTKCLPRAIALHWMLHRRGRRGVLALGVMPRDLRGTLDDLHAWVEIHGEIVLGDNGKQYHTLARFQFT